VANAITGNNSFKDAESQDAIYATSILVIGLYMVFIIAFSVGASILSYNYNCFIGTSSNMTVFYTILAFLFSSVYYPYYAIFLDPVGKKGQKGSRR
jgi:hypothetical protein